MWLTINIADLEGGVVASDGRFRVALYVAVDHEHLVFKGQSMGTPQPDVPITGHGGEALIPLNSEPLIKRLLRLECLVRDLIKGVRACERVTHVIDQHHLCLETSPQDDCG